VTFDPAVAGALAAGAAVVLLAVLVAVVRRGRARRRAAEEAALQASGERAIDRLAWLTGRAEAAPPVPPLPPAPAPAPVERLPHPGISPRRRLGRDAALVLLAGVGIVAVVAVLRPVSPDEAGGVLAATSSPVAPPNSSSPVAAPSPTAPASPAGPGSSSASPAAPPSPSASPANGTPAASSPSPPSPSASPTAAATPLVHVVRPGETLLRIAARYGVPIDAILAANPQIGDPNLIVSRTVIVIPRPAPSAPGEAATPGP
jgi:LysM repeat protein